MKQAESTLRRFLSYPLVRFARANYVYLTTAYKRLDGQESEHQLVGPFYTSRTMEHRLFMDFEMRDTGDGIEYKWRLHTEGIPGDFIQQNITDDPKLVGGKTYPHAKRRKAVEDMERAMHDLVELYQSKFGHWDGPSPTTWYSELGLSKFEPWQVAEYKSFKEWR